MRDMPTISSVVTGLPLSNIIYRQDPAGAVSLLILFIPEPSYWYGNKGDDKDEYPKYTYIS